MAWLLDGFGNTSWIDSDLVHGGVCSVNVEKDTSHAAVRGVVISSSVIPLSSIVIDLTKESSNAQDDRFEDANDYRKEAKRNQHHLHHTMPP